MRETNGSTTTTAGAGAGASSSMAAVENLFGQSLVKALSNACFSFFVVSVLVFTVIAITYKPPDPWLDTSKAITISFSDVLPNSTFHPDDSIFPTAEDATLANATASSSTSEDLLASVQTLPPPPLEPLLSSSPLSCNGTGSLPINCSDPAVLSAIIRFNSRVFKSILFISYEMPVSGGAPDKCDAAWYFRNRKEKSWRRYRDFRRFRFTPADNFSFKVSWAGKFRSGINARRRIPVPGKTPPSSPRPIKDVDINDTIPVIGSEEFKRGKYLYYSRGGDYCKGMNHYLWSFLCGLGEARYLNRTFVMDLDVCLAANYNPSNKDEEGKDFRFYFDFEHLKESSSVVEEHEFLRDWNTWERAMRGTKKKVISVRKVPTYKVTPMQLKRDRSTIIWRQFDGPEPENYWYRVCEGRAAKYVQRPWDAIWKSKRLINIVTEIAGKMDWDYDAVHVVRGEKARNKDLWPNLDGDTSPEALVDKLLKMVKEWRNLYIATNEPFYNYFDKLRSHYKVHLLDDYNELWSNKSEWYNETTELNGGKPVEFDGYMRMAVDTEVLYRAKTRVETFNNLTKDCKDGVNSCFQ